MKTGLLAQFITLSEIIENNQIFRVRGTILLAVLVRGHFVMTWLKVLSSNFLDLGYSSGR